MKFSLVAILPAVLWTVLLLLAGGRYDNADSQAGAYIITATLWFLTAAVLGLYWAARIVRFALRGQRGKHDLQPMRGQGPSVQV